MVEQPPLSDIDARSPWDAGTPGTVPALDRALHVTFFPDYGAQTKTEAAISLRQLIRPLRDTYAASKAALPWLKLARFGNTRTPSNSLRHNANLIEIDGIEADYDGETLTLARAEQVLREAGVAAVIYTSPSHRADAPRWRILCPTSMALPPDRRAELVARVNGLLVGALARESFTLSQSYYYGWVEGTSGHEVAAVEGRPIDLCTELDRGAVHRPELQRAAPVEAPTGRLPVTATDGTPYGLAALRSECAAVAGAPNGAKHPTLNKAAFSIGGLVTAGHLAEGPALSDLTAAVYDMHARTPCIDFGAAIKTLQAAFAAGKSRPRAVAERPEPQAITTGLFRQREGATAAEPQFDPETGEVLPAFPATPFDVDEMLAVEARKWVYGHFLIERFISVLGAPGGTGKTAYAVAVAMAVATGQELLGERVHQTGAVWIYNLEDPRDELLRRVHSAVIAYNIAPASLVGRLFLDSGRSRPLVIAQRDPDGSLVCLPVVDDLIAELKRRNVRLLIVDPFVKSHRLEENRNEQIDFAATQWGRVAEAASCSILLVHHFRKGAVGGEADAFRGASALIDASRAAVSLSVMTEQEADRFGVDPLKRRFFVRADNAKLNLAPPPDHALWMELHGVQLPNGDNVQVAQPWSPPSAWEGLPSKLVIEILELLNGDAPDGLPWRISKNSKAGWAGKAITDNSSLTAGQAEQVLRAWKDNGLLVPGEALSAKREPMKVYRVDATKLSEMRRDLGGQNA